MRRPLRSAAARAIANLAIELGDPGRMAKARRIHRSNGVSDVDIIRGAAFAVVSDGAGLQCEVEISVTTSPAGDSPGAEDLEVTCSAGDAADVVCIHGLAALLGVAEEIEGNARLLDTWSAPAVVIDLDPSDTPDEFLGGSWQAPTLRPLPPRPIGDPPQLVVEGLDAGPVFNDARETIRRAVSRFRAPQ